MGPPVEDLRVVGWTRTIVDFFEIAKTKTVDFFEIAKQLTNYGAYPFKLNDLLSVNGMHPKTSQGLQAIEWAKAGEWAKLESYCADDARLTWEVANLKEVNIPAHPTWRKANKSLFDPTKRLLFVPDTDAPPGGPPVFKVVQLPYGQQGAENAIPYILPASSATRARPKAKPAAPATPAVTTHIPAQELRGGGGVVGLPQRRTEAPSVVPAPAAPTAPEAKKSAPTAGVKRARGVEGQFVLIDSSGLVHRSYHGMLNANLTRKDGQAISGVLGFSRIVQEFRTKDFPGLQNGHT
ncbi:hypothetical protein T484DRAFT_1788910 [Baffinella frigidus]|nr:hypothetical protein T484DRAFT_1788910 [Cryptophyta sp. CCMP2293]